MLDLRVNHRSGCGTAYRTSDEDLLTRSLMYGMAIVAGIFNAVEPGQNASLSKALSLPWLAALILLAVNALVFLVLGTAAGGLHLPSVAQVRDVPWWAWLGGLTSAFIITSQLFVSEQLGASRFVGLVVTASVVTSLLLDNYGLVGFSKNPVHLWRMVGGALMIGGVILVAVF